MVGEADVYAEPKSGLTVTVPAVGGVVSLGTAVSVTVILADVVVPATPK